MPIVTTVSILPDDVPSSAAGVPGEFVRESGARDVLEKGGDAAAVGEESRRKQKNGKPKREYKKSWEERFDDLVVYKEKKGTCEVS